MRAGVQLNSPLSFTACTLPKPRTPLPSGLAHTNAFGHDSSECYGYNYSNCSQGSRYDKETQIH